MDDKELIESVERGNTNDFGILVEKYSSKIYRLCLSLCGNHADAEDAAQEAFIDAFRYLASLTDKEKFYPWLCMIARRKSYKQINSRMPFADLDEMEEFLSVGRDDTEHVLREEKRERVRKAVEKMSERRRQVCELFYFHGKKISEIASLLSLPEATVKSRLYDAREFLRKELCDMRTDRENISTLEEKIKKQIKALTYYYSLNGRKADEKFKSSAREIADLVGKIDDEQTKQYYLSDILTLESCAETDSEKKNAILERRKEAAEAGKNVELIADLLINEFLGAYNANGKEAALKFLDETALPTIEEYKSAPDYDTARGSLLFWRGRVLLDLNRTDEARAEFVKAAKLVKKDCAYQANAVAALRSIDTMLEKAYDPEIGYEATAEGLIYENGKLFFYNQPGFSRNSNIPGIHLDFNALFFYTSRCDETLFDTGMKPGEVKKGRDGTSSLECVSYDETVSVLAGIFERCMHVKTTADLSWRGYYTYDAWYAPGVGMVKATATNKERTENYELAEYSVKGGEGYQPFAVGNRWVYRGPDAPGYVFHDIERTVEYTDGYLTNLAVTSPVTLAKNFEDSEDLDSYVYLSFADKLCDDWKLDEAIEMLKKAIRLNANEEAVRISLYGIEVLSRFAEYQKRGFRFCPSSIVASCLRADGNTVGYTDETSFSFGPYRFGERGAYEDRIFGLKPFRYLNLLTGELWDSKWVPGYHEEKTVKGGLPFLFTVEDGGTVTVPAGTFADCRKVTLRIDKPAGKDDHWFFENWYENMDAGIKEYWFAPGVGIVKIVSTWGETCEAECVLKTYNVPASKESDFLPIQIGNRWEYEETHLVSEGYRASAIFGIASGMNGKYLMTSSQEFVCFKTEEEYKEFVKVSHLY